MTDRRTPSITGPGRLPGLLARSAVQWGLVALLSALMVLGLSLVVEIPQTKKGAESDRTSDGFRVIPSDERFASIEIDIDAREIATLQVSERLRLLGREWDGSFVISRRIPRWRDNDPTSPEVVVALTRSDFLRCGANTPGSPERFVSRNSTVIFSTFPGAECADPELIGEFAYSLSGVAVASTQTGWTVLKLPLFWSKHRPVDRLKVRLQVAAPRDVIECGYESLERVAAVQRCEGRGAKWTMTSVQTALDPARTTIDIDLGSLPSEAALNIVVRYPGVAGATSTLSS